MTPSSKRISQINKLRSCIGKKIVQGGSVANMCSGEIHNGFRHEHNPIENT